jgi:hypothetical protein
MARGRARGGAVEKAAGGDFAAENEVFIDSQFRHQAEFLENRADPDDALAMRVR